MDNISFTISNYEGFEEEVLRIRNQNRPRIVSRQYLDWRYYNNISLPPVIFWVQRFDGVIVGMASLLFHRFWINNEAHEVAVMGDISLNNDVRGKGISKELFKYINSYIEEHNLLAFVMPNFIASKSLLSTGWIIKERFISYVYIIDPTDKLTQYLPIKRMTLLLGQLYRKIINYRISSKDTLNYSMHFSRSFDDSFDEFWMDIPKQGIILKDRSSPSLRWRYENHPYIEFIVVKFMKDKLFIGYLIYMIDNSDTCIVYDVIAKNKDHIRILLYLFLKHLLNNSMIKMLRIPMNNNHYYSGLIRRSGFIKRENDNIIQIYNSSLHWEQLNSYRWLDTAGDKDV